MDAPGHVGKFAFLPGELIAERYELIEELGRGGMSVVYRCRESLLQREVALKVFLASNRQIDDKFNERFRKEVRATSSLNHPNIVKVFGSGVAGNNPYMAMELVQGKTLEVILKEEGVLSAVRLKNIFIPVMDAIDYAHEKQIIHRDLKPSNIMLQMGVDTAGSVVKVLDFGLAKILNETESTAAATVGFAGTPFYMSPEQCQGLPVDARSDLYSLSCLLYECISGNPPFVKDTTLEIMYGHMHGEVPALDGLSASQGISAALVKVICKGLSKEPSARQQNMSQFRQEFLSALSAPIVDTGKASKNLLVWGIVGLVLIVGLTLLLLMNPRKSVLAIEPERTKSRHIEPLSPEAQYAAAQTLFSEGKFRESLQKAQDLLPTFRRRKDKTFLVHTLSLAAGAAGSSSEYQLESKLYEEESRYVEFGSIASVEAVSGRASALISLGKYTEAEKVLKDYLNRDSRESPDEASHHRGRICANYADLLFKQRRLEETIALAKEALRNFDASVGRKNSAAVSAAAAYYSAQKLLGHKADGKKELDITSQELTLPGKIRVEHQSAPAQEHANFLMSQGYLDEAEAMFATALHWNVSAPPNEQRSVHKACMEGLAYIKRQRSKHPVEER